MTDADWTRVATAVKQRRRSMGYKTQQGAAAAADVSPTTWGKLEAGKSDFKPWSLTGIATFLGWTEESFDQIAEGGEPTLLPNAASDAHSMRTVAQQRLEFGVALRTVADSRGLSGQRLADLLTERGYEYQRATVNGWMLGQWAPPGPVVYELEDILAAEGELTPLLGLADRRGGRLDEVERRLAAIESALDKLIAKGGK